MKACKNGIILLLFSIFAANVSYAQDPDTFSIKLKSAAQDIMRSTGLCAFITIDRHGKPLARMMDPFSPDSNFVVWFGTNPKSRKAREIKRNPAVCLYYTNPSISGYVMIQGTAKLVNDPKEKNNRWKTAWHEFYKSRELDYILIKVTPSRLEVVNYNAGIVSVNPETWEVPYIKF